MTATTTEIVVAGKTAEQAADMFKEHNVVPTRGVYFTPAEEIGGQPEGCLRGVFEEFHYGEFKNESYAVRSAIEYGFEGWVPTDSQIEDLGQDTYRDYYAYGRKVADLVGLPRESTFINQTPEAEVAFLKDA